MKRTIQRRRKPPKERVRAVLEGLADTYGKAECALIHDNPLQLLVATILSAQCTDERVNMVTPALFDKYPDAQALAGATQEEIERVIHSTGFFRNKAKNIRGAAAKLASEHHGEVPRTMEELLPLPGVARKTANVVLGTAYGLPSGVVVDTHVSRVSRRLGFTKEKDPVKIERDLMEILPREEWIDFSHRLIHHGRRTCKARKPACGECPILEHCPEGRRNV